VGDGVIQKATDFYHGLLGDSPEVSGLPQSSQNAEEGEFSAAQLGQFLISALPQQAENFRLVVLSFPHFVQRMSFLR
jgi:hypothetical protein